MATTQRRAFSGEERESGSPQAHDVARVVSRRRAPGRATSADGQPRLSVHQPPRRRRPQFGLAEDASAALPELSARRIAGCPSPRRAPLPREPRPPARPAAGAPSRPPPSGSTSSDSRTGAAGRARRRRGRSGARRPRRGWARRASSSRAARLRAAPGQQRGERRPAAVAASREQERRPQRLDKAGEALRVGPRVVGAGSRAADATSPLMSSASSAARRRARAEERRCGVTQDRGCMLPPSAPHSRTSMRLAAAPPAPAPPRTRSAAAARSGVATRRFRRSAAPADGEQRERALRPGPGRRSARRPP